MPKLAVDLCVIGAGSGGLSVAAGAAQMGAKVALIERGKMGGDCLNYGCVPSKSLLASAKRAQMMRQVTPFGIESVSPRIDFKHVHDHIKNIIAKIAPHDSVERFQGLGVTVVQGTATFAGPAEVSVADTLVQAKYFVIATGSSPVAPPITGIESIHYLTNETIFDLTEQPRQLIVIGGGPIGCELSQAYALLGVPVTILEAFTILPKDDPELVDIVRKQLVKNSLVLHEEIKVSRVENKGENISVTFEKGAKEITIEGSHLLVSAGRKPNLENLNLDAAGVKYNKRGIEVDHRLRSSNKRIFAIGDAAGSFQFTHAANYHAGIVLRNALFHLPAKVSYDAMPWVTYTDPELAHVGLNEPMAKQQGLQFQVLQFPFNELDRAVAEHETEGLIKVIVSPKGKVLGASIVGANAGELIAPWVLAIHQKLSIGTLASMIMPYPTFSEISKRVAGEFYTPKLFSKRVRKIVRFLMKF